MFKLLINWSGPDPGLQAVNPQVLLLSTSPAFNSPTTVLPPCCQYQAILLGDSVNNLPKVVMQSFFD